MTKPSILLFFENLTVTGTGANRRRPLSALNGNSHIHGGLRIVIGGRTVPHLGYFGPDDVCFFAWFEEFEKIIETFQDRANATYTFDEGEQGQPAFRFDKRADTVYLSITDSEISDGSGDPDWQNVVFSYEDFTTAYKKLKADFLAELDRAAPRAKEKWLRTYLKGFNR